MNYRECMKGTLFKYTILIMRYLLYFVQNTFEVYFENNYCRYIDFNIQTANMRVIMVNYIAYRSIIVSATLSMRALFSLCLSMRFSLI